MENNVKWFLQGCLRINDGGTVIYTDPYAVDENYRDADIILITHDHFDHFSPEDIKKTAKEDTVFIMPPSVKNSFLQACGGRYMILAAGQQLTACGIDIKAVPAYNIVKTQCHPRANGWVGYIITLADGSILYYTGDTELIPEMKEISADVVFLPLGQKYTFESVDDALTAVGLCGAEYAVPVHYGEFEGTAADVDYFRRKLTAAQAVIL